MININKMPVHLKKYIYEKNREFGEELLDVVKEDILM